MTEYANKSLTFGAPCPIGEVKASGETREVSGYVATYDLDLGNDRVSKGAFTKTLASGHRVRFLYGHDARQILGTTEELREDDKGLFGRFRISRTQLGDDVHTLLKDGALDSFSIGFLPDEYELDKKSGARTLSAISLLECSLVALPMNPQALVTGVKGLDYGALNLEALLTVYEDHHRAALGQAKAVAQRRLSEGRKLSDTTLAVLERLRSLSEDGAAELLRLSTTPPQPPRDSDTPAPAEAVGPLVDAHLRRARLRELGRVYGVTIP